MNHAKHAAQCAFHLPVRDSSIGKELFERTEGLNGHTHPLVVADKPFVVIAFSHAASASQLLHCLPRFNHGPMAIFTRHLSGLDGCLNLLDSLKIGSTQIGAIHFGLRLLVGVIVLCNRQAQW